MSLETFSEASSVEKERMREDAFSRVIQRDVIEGFKDALAEAGFSAEEDQEFDNALGAFPETVRSGLLSMPFSLRANRLSKFHERVVKGELSVEDMVGLLAKEAEEKKFCLGYHVSNADILPRKVKTGGIEWSVDGKEADHRDGDVAMAYYSTGLKTLYGRKRARFIYVVRADKGPDTTHRQDNDGSWGRAPKLDVVAKFDLEQVMREVNDAANGVRGYT